MVHPVEDQSFVDRMQCIEGLIQEMERFPDPAAQKLAREIVQSLLELHGTGLARILEHLAEAGPSGQAVLTEAAEDPLVSNLLLLHGIHPDGLDTRVRRALEKIGPTLQAREARAMLVSVADGVVRMRLESRSGVPAVRQILEEAILAGAPDVGAIEIEVLR